MSSDLTPSPPLHPESTRDVLDALGAGIAKLATREERPELQHRGTQTAADLARQLLTGKVLADRWMSSVARLQRWRSVGKGPPYLEIVGKVLYWSKDIETYEETCLIRRGL
jgi:hypothetical protein